MNDTGGPKRGLESVECALGADRMTVQGAGRSAVETIVMAWISAVQAQLGPRVDQWCGVVGAVTGPPI